MSRHPKITLKQAIKEVKHYDYCAPKGWEFLRREDGKNLYFLPTGRVVERFKQTVGDKWNCRKTDQISIDLRETSIVITGRFITARGGLCPSGLRLFEIVDKPDDTAIRIDSLTDWKRKVFVGQMYNSWMQEADGTIHSTRVREVGLKQTNCIAFRVTGAKDEHPNDMSWLYWPKASEVTLIQEENKPTIIKIKNDVMNNHLFYQPMTDRQED